MESSPVIAVLGSMGMLGSDVTQELESRGLEFVALSHEEADITQPASIAKALEQSGATAVINCAAYTNVNGAETEEDRAFQVNGAGAENVATSCQKLRMRCIYVGTDYVFDGTKTEAYLEQDETNPINAYGRTKLAGELATAKACDNHAIARTSWLYGRNGKNFVIAMLTLAQTGKPLKVVQDQVGAPTFTEDLARALVDLALNDARGIFHVTNGGHCSWFEFAKRIFELTDLRPSQLEPVTSDKFPTPARRPANSRLADTRLAAAGVAPLPHWEDALRRFLHA